MGADSIEVAFEYGRRQVEAGNYREALPFFKEMVEKGKKEGNGNFSQPAHKSYYALCMTMVYGPTREAIQLSERAVSKEFYNPDLFCNLGLVYMRCGKRGPAFRAFRRGLALKLNHHRISKALKKYEDRGKRFLKFLPRCHFLNRWIGQIRFRLEGDSDS